MGSRSLVGLFVVKQFGEVAEAGTREDAVAASNPYDPKRLFNTTKCEGYCSSIYFQYGRGNVWWRHLWYSGICDTLAIVSIVTSPKSVGALPISDLLTRRQRNLKFKHFFWNQVNYHIICRTGLNIVSAKRTWAKGCFDSHKEACFRGCIAHDWENNGHKVSTDQCVDGCVDSHEVLFYFFMI